MQVSRKTHIPPSCNNSCVGQKSRAQSLLDLPHPIQVHADFAMIEFTNQKAMLLTVVLCLAQLTDPLSA